MQTKEIEIKGIKNGILIELKAGEWENQKESLLSHIDDNLAFFKSARIVLDVGDLTLKSPDLSGLRNTLADRDIKLKAVKHIPGH